MLPIGGCEHQAIAGLYGIPGLDASRSWIGTEQSIDGVPSIGVMNCTGGKDIVLQFDQLCKERIGHSKTCEVRQVCGGGVLVGIRPTLRRQVGQPIRVDVVSLGEMESLSKQVHLPDKVTRRAPNGISNGNSSIVTRRQHEPIEQILQ